VSLGYSGSHTMRVSCQRLKGIFFLMDEIGVITLLNPMRRGGFLR
jgi:hypothetical protein